MPILHVRPRRQEKGRIYRGCNRFLLRDDCLCVERKDWDGPGGLGSSRRVCCCRAQKKYEIKVIKIISKIGSFLKKIHYTDIEVLLSPPMESNESRNSPIGSWLVLVMIDFSGSLLKYFFFQQRFTFTPYICKQTSTFVLRALIAFERKKKRCQQQHGGTGSREYCINNDYHSSVQQDISPPWYCITVFKIIFFPPLYQVIKNSHCI